MKWMKGDASVAKKKAASSRPRQKLIGDKSEKPGLLKAMEQLPLFTTAVFVIDEQKDNDPYAAYTHRAQSAVLKRAVELGMKIIVIRYIDEYGEGRCEPLIKDIYLPVHIREFVPDGTDSYTKPHPNAFHKTNLEHDIKWVTDIIIMGQSTNACCGWTAGNAGQIGKQVHTTRSIVRSNLGLSYESIAKNDTGYSWPQSTIIYPHL